MIQTTPEERPKFEDVEGQHKKEEEEETDEEGDEEEDTREPLKVRLAKGFKKWKKNTKYRLYHRKKGRTFICTNNCDYWCSHLWFSCFLWVFVAAFFIAYMSIGSEMMPFSFLVFKYREASDIATPISARDYFGTRNATNSTSG